MRYVRHLLAVLLVLLVFLGTTAGGQEVTRRAVMIGGRILFGAGTSGAPSIAFTAEPTLGFWRSSAATITLQGGLTTTGNLQIPATGFLGFSTRGQLQSGADGFLQPENNAGTIGALIKVDALPTIASGFGTSPSITAGSTPYAGSINIGTGGTATTGVVTFGGTAFPSTPFCTLSAQGAGGFVIHPTPTTTQLTITSAPAFPASDIVIWHCTSAK